jgi:SAM-dependent methyltransferase
MHPARAIARRFYHAAGRGLARSGLLPGPKFLCPICDFAGTFPTSYGANGPRLYCRCPRCSAAERHRLQKLVLDAIRPEISHDARILQFAPDAMTEILRSFSTDVTTADIVPKRGSIELDLTALQLEDETIDLIFASHVMEHISDDALAIKEIFRVLKPGGLAVLPVPIVAQETIEYPRHVRDVDGHVRAPGLDYFDRYRASIGNVRVFTSADFDEKYQVWIYEDRTRLPSADAPFRPAMNGIRHIDAVPVCRKAGP